MDVNTIVTLVGSLGFPIVCCGALFYQQNRHMKELGDKIEDSMDKLSSNILNNTIATERLVTIVEIIYRLEGEQDGE